MLLMVVTGLKSINLSDELHTLVSREKLIKNFHCKSCKENPLFALTVINNLFISSDPWWGGLQACQVQEVQENTETLL